ncbi:unnamed protein product [Echinostoma caproni]|uniref:P/Homo B domain-containing protein n=1 Tax=Echinostoma caproni TaxID=27848 RepID=A0A183AFZ7_9TREM|nr:unnamed protein product [Echinostoma caproni]
MGLIGATFTPGGSEASLSSALSFSCQLNCFLVTVSSAQRGEIELWLTSPSGTVSKLLSKRPKDIEVAGFHAWPFMSVHYWGELANGTWKLTVHSGKAVVGKSQPSYPGYPFYYYSNAPGAYGFWPMWNQDGQNTAQYLPPSVSSQNSADSHVPSHSAAAEPGPPPPPPPPPPIASRLYAHLFPPNIHGVDEHHSSNPDTSVRHGSLDDPRPPNPFISDTNPLFDLDLPPILGSAGETVGDQPNPTALDGSASSMISSRLDGMSRTGSLRPPVPSISLPSAATTTARIARFFSVHWQPTLFITFLTTLTI